MSVCVCVDIKIEKERNKQWDDKARPAHSNSPNGQPQNEKENTLRELGGGGGRAVVYVRRPWEQKKKTNYISFLLFCFLHTGQQQLSLILFVRLFGPDWWVHLCLVSLSDGQTQNSGCYDLHTRLYTNQNTRTRQTDSSPLTAVVWWSS